MGYPAAKNHRFPYISTACSILFWDAKGWPMALAMASQDAKSMTLRVHFDAEVGDPQGLVMFSWGSHISNVTMVYGTLWQFNIAMENHHAINGKTHYFYGHFQ